MHRDIKDGDIYRWSYRRPPTQHGDYAYWCKSRIAVAKDGLLTDTYWHLGSGSAAVWTYDEAEATLVLDYVGNFAALDKSNEYEARYYANEDIVDLNHANSPKGNFYLRKGAVRSRAKMLEHATYEAERAESAMRMAKHQAERLRQVVERINAGDDLAPLCL